MRGRAVDRMNGSAAHLLHVRMAEPCGGVRAARRWPNCMMEPNPRDVREPMPHWSATCPARSRPNPCGVCAGRRGGYAAPRRCGQ